jgi:paraquat-inducible protein B
LNRHRLNGRAPPNNEPRLPVRLAPVKIRLNPLILGAFIVGGIVLAVVALLALGSTNIFKPTGHFLMYLPDSAQGVGPRTAISLEGVRVGQVDQIHVLYERQTRKSIVSVVCRITENLLTDVHGRQINLTDPSTIQDLVAEGLFAQVQTSGLVGSKFIELGFNPVSAPTMPTDMPASPYPVIPTVPSTMSELTDNISHILSKIREMDFPGISQRLEDVLASARRQIGELETNRLTTHISDAAASFDHFMSSPDLHQAVTRIQTAAGSLQTLVTNLNSQVPPVVTNLNTTLASAGQTVQDLRDFLALRNELGQQMQDLLKQLNRTARAIEQLADFLERHPNALITGRAPGSSTSP